MLIHLHIMHWKLGPKLVNMPSQGQSILEMLSKSADIYLIDLITIHNVYIYMYIRIIHILYIHRVCIRIHTSSYIISYIICMIRVSNLCIHMYHGHLYMSRPSPGSPQQDPGLSLLQRWILDAVLWVSWIIGCLLGGLFVALK